MEINPKKLIDSYLQQSTWIVKENSNNGYSYPSLRSHIASKVMSEYALDTIYQGTIAEAHRSCKFHIHDLGHALAPYCMGHSLRDLLQEGFSDIPGRAGAAPPKHLRTACHQMANYLATLQSEAAGAQAFNGCFSDDTEILTENGWKVFEDLGKGEAVLTFNRQTGRSEYQVPIDYIKYHYSGDMYHFKGNVRDLLVTPNHKMLLKQRNKRSEVKFLLEEAQNLTYGADGYNRHTIPYHSEWVGYTPHKYYISERVGFNTLDFLALLGIFLSEGSLNAYAKRNKKYTISISQIKKHIRVQIEELLTRMGFKWAYSGGSYTFNCKDLYLYLEKFGSSYDKYIPRDILTMGIEALTVLKDWLIKGDGHITPEGYERYFTTSTRLRDDLTELYTKLGKKTSYYIHNHIGHISNIRGEKVTSLKECWGITAFSAKSGRLFKPCIIQYSGDVYCVNVPNHTIMVRRNGKADWCGNCDTFLAPFIKKDNLQYTEVLQCMQELVYNLNIPSRSGEIPFTNFSFDWMCPEDLKDQNPFVGGEVLGFSYKDCQVEMDMINQAFIEVMSRGDDCGRMFSFPIPTYSITKSFDWEHPNTLPLFDLTAKYGTPYFQNFVNSDLDPESVRSMCPLPGDTELLVSTSKGIRNIKLSEVVKNQSRGFPHKVLYNGLWHKAIATSQGKQEIYNITLSNGVQIRLGKHHLQPTNRGTIEAQYLSIGDALPFNQVGYDTNLGSHELGLAIGAYIGDGSIHEEGLIYSLNVDTDKEFAIGLERFFNSLGFKTSQSIEGKLLTVRVGSGSKSIISRYVKGLATTKELSNKVFELSLECRKGILEGWMQSDGGNRRRIYTFSETLKNQFDELCTSVGLVAKLDSIDTREGRLSSNPCYVLKSIIRDSYKDLFYTENNMKYFYIKKIERTAPEEVYCFEVDNDDRLFVLSNGLITHNCRLSLRLDELRKGGGIFGKYDLTGSINVITINLPQLGYLAKDIDDFYGKLFDVMRIAKEAHEIKRRMLNENLERGLYPYIKRWMPKGFKNHFSTIGIVGMKECLQNLFHAEDKRHSIINDEAKEFCLELMDWFLERIREFQMETGNLYNLEESPAEGVCHRFASKDREVYPLIAQSGTEGEYYYTQGCKLPFGLTHDIFDVLRHQQEISEKYTGGSVQHIFLGENIKAEGAKRLIKTILTNFRTPYITLSPTFSVCRSHGMYQGEVHNCPICDLKCEIYSRIVGYYSPTYRWNNAKQGEWKDRKTFEKSVQDFI